MIHGIKPFAKARERPTRAPTAAEAQKTLKRRMRNITTPFGPNRTVSRRPQTPCDRSIPAGLGRSRCFFSSFVVFIIPSLKYLMDK
jgi:hypothetical protein